MNLKKSNLKTLGTEEIEKAQSNFMSKVFSWMCMGLFLTGIVAWASFESGLTVQLGGMLILLFLPLLGLVWFISARIQTMSSTTAIISFIVYSCLNGIFLSTIFGVYTDSSISNIFIITGFSFIGLAFYGFSTKKSLSGMGNFLFVGLIGIIIASVFNIFIGSSILMLTISILAVLIFAGLTAYDTQRIKETYLEIAGNEEMESKVAIVGALSLYLNFINMFLALLRIFGDTD